MMNLTASNYDTVARETGLARWIRPVSPARRLCWTSTEDPAQVRLPGPHEATFRLDSPTRGHDRVWLVATKGQFPEGAVVRALQQHGCQVNASTVHALHPDTKLYESMVMVQASTEAATQDILTGIAGAHLKVGGH